MGDFYFSNGNLYFFFVRHCQNLKIFSCVTDFVKCHNVSKRNVKLILKILRVLRLSVEQKKTCIQLVRV
jgi:hypothetical protein